MSGICHITAIGNMGKDPEVFATQKGTTICRGSIGITPSKDAKTLWFNFSIFGKRGEIFANAVHKGDRVCLIGRLEAGVYDDKKTGQPREITNFMVDNFVFLNPPKSLGAKQTREAPVEPEESEDDIPF